MGVSRMSERNARPRQVTNPDPNSWYLWAHPESPYQGYAHILYLPQTDEYFLDYEIGWWITTDGEHYESYDEAYEEADLVMIAIEQDLMCID